jgi:hypothetical protein
MTQNNEWGSKKNGTKTKGQTWGKKRATAATAGGAVYMLQNFFCVAYFLLSSISSSSLGYIVVFG